MAYGKHLLVAVDRLVNAVCGGWPGHNSGWRSAGVWPGKARHF